MVQGDLAGDEERAEEDQKLRRSEDECAAGSALKIRVEDER